MNKFKVFLNKLKLKIKEIPPIELIGVTFIISLTIWYIITLFNNNDKPNKPLGPLCNTSGKDSTTRCDYGQVCQTNCKPNPQCSEPCQPGTKYYCDLQKCDKDCGPDIPYLNTSCGKSDSKNVRCIKSPNGELTDKGQEYQSLVPQPNGDDCTWLNGFTKDQCKLTDSTGKLYGDCINNLPDSSPYSFNTKLNNSFKCGYINDNTNLANGKNKFTQQGQDNILKDSGNSLNLSVFNCDKSPKSNFTSIVDDWNTIGKNSNKKLINTDGTKSSVQNSNDICGVHTSNGYIDGYNQIIDCSQGGKIENNAWKNYYTSLNCDSNGLSTSSDICNVPCWMFKTQSNKANGQGSSCDGTSSCAISGSFDSQCLWNNDSCDSTDFTFDKIKQSCNYDSNGCSTKLDSSGIILVPTLENDICTYTDGTSLPKEQNTGCRPNGSSYNWNGSECVMGILTSNCIQSVNFDIDYRGNSISIKSIDFNIDNCEFMDLLLSSLENNSPVTFNVLIYQIQNNKVDMSNQVYAINNNNNIKIDYTPSQLNMTLRGNISDNIIYFPPNSESSTLKSYNSFKQGNFFIGLSIKIGNLIINSVEYSQNLNNVDMSNSKNIFTK
jgi:hypothetical protein